MAGRVVTQPIFGLREPGYEEARWTRLAHANKQFGEIRRRPVEESARAKPEERNIVFSYVRAGKVTEPSHSRIFLERLPSIVEH